MTEPHPPESSAATQEQAARRDLQKLALRIAAEPHVEDASGDPHATASAAEAAVSPPDFAAALGPTASSAVDLMHLAQDFTLTVVMPVFNERDTIEAIIGRVLDTWLPIELLIVDDWSRDGTREVLQRIAAAPLPHDVHPRSNLRVLFHEQNQGKGAALKTGFEQATGNVVVVQDADQEYDPEDFFELLPILLRDEADVVYGSRFSQQSDSSSPGWHRFGNQLITRTSNLFTRLHLTDVETCYKMFKREALSPIVPTLREKGFGIELEITGKLARQADVRFAERPIRYRKRGYAEGKKIGWQDAVWALWCILRYRAILR